jgi:hypothetical protein
LIAELYYLLYLTRALGENDQGGVGLKVFYPVPAIEVARLRVAQDAVGLKDVCQCRG